MLKRFLVQAHFDMDEIVCKFVIGPRMKISS